MSIDYKQEIYPMETYSSSMWLDDDKFGRIRRWFKKELPVFLGEFVGTFMFLFFAFAGTQIAADSTPPNPLLAIDQPIPPNPAKLLYISFAFGFSLLVNVAIFADVSGAMFNPAVTLTMWAIGNIRWERAIHAVIAQLLSAIIAAFSASAMLPSKLAVATTVNEKTTSVSQGFFLEIFMTAQLILAILMVPSGPSKPMYCGFALFIAQLAGIYSTGASLNPVRSLGPIAVVGAQSSDWIYILGPIFGAGMATGIYKLVALTPTDGK
ncbi:aquaporin-like protein [Periconia macrospinosa]|uniref:Aquaporin-like protein n=1 Tax=Periconia macrospinosa TaxID=97972 RepID=A0A2V1ECR5_9PLEO|nr:aquaporin-like protein [Periconia macrospinosa]